MVHIPTWVPGFVVRLFEVFIPKRPSLTVEIHEVCEDKILADMDANGYTVDLYIFLRVWVVNMKEVHTVPKEWALTVKVDGEHTQAELVPDISKWHQHLKVKKKHHGLTVIEDHRENLTPFGKQVFQRGIPNEGWICFAVRGTEDTLLQRATLRLTLTDSFGGKHQLKSGGPWKCKGNMVNPDMLY